MKKTISVPLIILFGILSNKIWSQADSLKIDKANPIIYYFGLGAGPTIRGGFGELSFTIASSNYWGGSINFKRGFVRMENVPDDYYGLFRFSPPTDDYTFLSFDLLKKFSTSNKTVRFGFEAGPALIWYNLVELELNPKYPDLFQYKYSKIYTFESTFGVALKATTEFPFSRFVGCELDVFTVLNKLQSVVGFGICLNLGRVRN